MGSSAPQGGSSVAGAAGDLGFDWFPWVSSVGPGGGKPGSSPLRLRIKSHGGLGTSSSILSMNQVDLVVNW